MDLTDYHAAYYAHDLTRRSTDSLDRLRRRCSTPPWTSTLTFAQAVKGNASLSDTYAKSILFDYSYRYFYNDGFGKDHHIANLQDDSERSPRAGTAGG
ncbi:MAG: hypothetical protein GXX83_00370 [Gaiellales bacterium]|nr:hypothetical protein [Gaiellales bacterium]